MKRKSWPIWLLRDVPAFLGIMLSFWPLVILVISSGRRIARGRKLRWSVFQNICGFLAHAESRLVFALQRQAYRRLGWNPRLVRFTLIPAPDTLDEAKARYASYVIAFGDMNAVVEDYILDIRQRYNISRRALVAHGSTDARLCRAAHHELAPARAASARPSTGRAEAARRRKDERGYAHARGPPLTPNFRPPTPPSPRSIRFRGRDHMRKRETPANKNPGRRNALRGHVVCEVRQIS